MKDGQISLSDFPLRKPIAHGRTADIFPWEDGCVLKLFHDWYGLENVQYEAQIAHAVQASGLPVPGVGSIIKVNGRDGLVYERVNGATMQENLQHQPWLLFFYARHLAVLHAQMHTLEIKVALPPQRQRLVNKIRHARALPENLKSSLLGTLNALPDASRICHGDFHPGNILMTTDGEIVIDWVDGTLGNPLADVARSTILALGSAASDQVFSPVIKLLIRLFRAVSMRHYFRLCPGGEAEYRRWLPVMAGARLSENIPELENWLLAQAKNPLRPFWREKPCP